MKNATDCLRTRGRPEPGRRGAAQPKSGRGRPVREIPLLRSLLTALAFLLLASALQAQLYTRKTGRMDEDRFNLDVRLEQFTSATDARLFKTTWIIPHVGVNPRIEMSAWFPIISVTNMRTREYASSLGDIQIDVKYQLKKNWFRMPLFQKEKETIYYLNIYLGFLGTVGPQQGEFHGLFWPYNRHLQEVRFGSVFGAYTRQFEFFANLNTVYAGAKGEKFFAFADQAFNFSKNNTIILWNIHKVLLKFIWPGKQFGEWPFGNDYCEFNLSLGYWFEIKPIIFKYKFFVEFNGRKVYNTGLCSVTDQYQAGGGVTVRFFRGLKATLGAVVPLYSKEYRGVKYTFGVMASL